MSPPLTVAWKDQPFHVCRGEEMSCRRGGGGGGGRPWSGSPLFFLTFAQTAAEEDAGGRGGFTVLYVACTEWDRCGEKCMN